MRTAGGTDGGDGGAGGEGGNLGCGWSLVGRAILGGALAAPPFAVNSPGDLVTESEASYDDNEFGIISGSTLSAWIDDWQANKPAGIEGRLIIRAAGPAGRRTLPSATMTKTYLPTPSTSTPTLTPQLRNNGLLDTFATIPDGEHTDDILNEFHIDLGRGSGGLCPADVDSVPGTPANDHPAVDNPARDEGLVQHAQLVVASLLGRRSRALGHSGRCSRRRSRCRETSSRRRVSRPTNLATSSVKELEVDNTAR